MIVSCRRSELAGADRHRRRCRIAPRFGALGVDSARGPPHIASGPHRGRRASRALAISLTVGDPLGGCVLRSSATSDLVAASGSRVQLALEQRNEVLVVLERFGLASCGGQRLYDQPMGVLAHVVESDGALAGLQSVFGAAGGQLLFAEPHHGAKGEFK